MWVMRVLAATLGVSVLAFGAVAASSASAAPPGDRPRNVADVKADSIVLLHPDGTLTATVRVRCDEGWVAGDISATVTQGASTADGFASASVPCDGRWYPVDVPLVGSGSFQPGKVTFSFLQFLVTNAVTGDSAGAHDNGASARLQPAS